MTGFELLEKLVKMPNEALKLQIYCGINGGDEEEIVEAFVDRDGSVTMTTAGDREEYTRRYNEEPETDNSLEGQYIRNCERGWEAQFREGGIAV